MHFRFPPRQFSHPTGLPCQPSCCADDDDDAIATAATTAVGTSACDDNGERRRRRRRQRRGEFIVMRIEDVRELDRDDEGAGESGLI